MCVFCFVCLLLNTHQTKSESQVESFSPLKKSLVLLPLGNFESEKFKYFMYDIIFLENYLHKLLHSSICAFSVLILSHIREISGLN